MPHQFVPFASKIAPSETSRGESNTFAALEPGNVEPDKPSTTPDTSQNLIPQQHGCLPPKIELKREGDRITHIQIECSCGQVIHFECLY